MASPDGLVSATKNKLRCTIVCLHGTDIVFEEALRKQWSDCTAEKAHEKLSAEAITVTNKSDKAVQLPKIFAFNDTVRRHMLSQGAPSGGAPRLSRPSSARQHQQPATSAPDEKCKGLLALLEGLGIPDKIGAAEAWFDEQGLDSLAELKEAEMEEDLAKAIELKPGKKKLFLSRIEAL